MQTGTEEIRAVQEAPLETTQESETIEQPSDGVTDEQEPEGEKNETVRDTVTRALAEEKLKSEGTET